MKANDNFETELERTSEEKWAIRKFKFRVFSKIFIFAFKRLGEKLGIAKKK